MDLPRDFSAFNTVKALNVQYSILKNYSFFYQNEFKYKVRVTFSFEAAEDKREFQVISVLAKWWRHSEVLRYLCMWMTNTSKFTTLKTRSNLCYFSASPKTCRSVSASSFIPKTQQTTLFTLELQKLCKVGKNGWYQDCSVRFIETLFEYTVSAEILRALKLLHVFCCCFVANINMFTYHEFQSSLGL